MRAYRPGGTFFFTLVTYDRTPFLCDERARMLLHEAIAACGRNHPFTIDAMVLLPDHLHAIWTLPKGDADFSTRFAVLKKGFTERWLSAGGCEGRITGSRRRNRRRGVWQRRFWEHAIRDEDDLINHLNYIHYNPVKHGLCACPHAWPHSTFGRWCDAGRYRRDWCCTCDGTMRRSPSRGWRRRRWSDRCPPRRAPLVVDGPHGGRDTSWCSNTARVGRRSAPTIRRAAVSHSPQPHLG